MENKRIVHFDEIILKEASLYISKIEELAAKLGERLPYAELLTLNNAVRADNWRNLAGVALLNKAESSEDVEKLIDELDYCIPNVKEKLETAENDKKNELYERFKGMNEVHDVMKHIPWNYLREKKYEEFLCHQLVDDYFY